MAEQPQNGTAMVRHEEQRETGLARHEEHRALSFAEMMKMGEALVGTGFLPDHIKTGAQCAAIILTGQELGMTPMRAVRSLQMVKGKVTESADSQLARFKAAGGKAKFLRLDAKGAELWLQHPNGDEHTETWTVEDAKAAGLSGGMHSKYPKAMNRSRVITAGLKSLGWDGAVGAYDPDEARAFADESAPEPAVREVTPEPPLDRELALRVLSEAPDKSATKEQRAEYFKRVRGEGGDKRILAMLWATLKHDGGADLTEKERADHEAALSLLDVTPAPDDVQDAEFTEHPPAPSSTKSATTRAKPTSTASSPTSTSGGTSTGTDARAELVDVLLALDGLRAEEDEPQSVFSQVVEGLLADNTGKLTADEKRLVEVYSVRIENREFKRAPYLGVDVTDHDLLERAEAIVAAHKG